MILAAVDPTHADDRHCAVDHLILRTAPEHVHVREGELVEITQSLLESMAVDLLVLSALSRSRLKRALVGGTAEKLLRAVDADILVIKRSAA